MKAKQNIAETTRNLDGLRDRMKTEVTTNLQTERANLRDTLLRQETEQKLLLEFLSDDAGRLSDDPERVSYTISREAEGGRQEIHGDPASVLQPGDVVTIKPLDAARSVDQVASTNAIQNLPAAAR
jgi:polysaccharide export outer membrane protein